MRRLIPFMRLAADKSGQTDRGVETGALANVMARPTKRPSPRSIATGALVAGGIAAGGVGYIERASLSAAIIDASASA